MVNLKDLTQYIDTALAVRTFKDYSPNGLQIEGKKEVNCLITGVTANLALIEKAIEKKADALLVHHGFFWKNENPTITGIKKKRIQLLLKHDISLLGYHLPLDAHLKWGNNAQIAERLAIQSQGFLDKQKVGNFGLLKESISLNNFADQVNHSFSRQPLVIAAGNHPIKKIAWCSGGGQSYLQYAVDLQVDAFLSGEISENSVHLAKESGVHYIAAGHHATERDGVKILGEHLAKKFHLKHYFIDIDNPI